jgi:hypothetical protein
MSVGRVLRIFGRLAAAPRNERSLSKREGWMVVCRVFNIDYQLIVIFRNSGMLFGQ